METLTSVQRMFRMRSCARSSTEIQQRIIDSLEAFSYSEKDVFAVRMALEEALTNAIQHGNGSDPTKLVCVDLTIDSHQVSICIEDEGSGFCASEARDPTLAECIELPHGRGIFLMRNFMDSVEYSPAGNTVTIQRRRSGEF